MCALCVPILASLLSLLAQLLHNAVVVWHRFSAWLLLLEHRGNGKGTEAEVEVWHENVRCIWMVSCREEESEICPV
jgi:hypothetical protein